MGTDAAEIIRLRDRVHDLGGKYVGLRTLYEEQARGIGELRDELHDCRRIVDDMTKADEIAQAVTAALRSERRAWWKGWRQVTVAAAGLIMIVPAIHDAYSWLG